MNTSVKKNICGAVISLVLFFVLILLVKTVDVAAIGPEGTSIGLSGINSAVHEFFGISQNWYLITELFGFIAIAVVLEYAFIGLFELITRKSFAKVDKYLYCLGGLYVVVFGLYALFEKVVINYRPIIEEGAEHVEASFPSSHTMLVCTVMGSACLVIKKYGARNGKVNEKLLMLSMIVMCIVTVLGRLICGVHWFSDIVGGVLISAAMLFSFAAALEIVDGNK